MMTRRMGCASLHTGKTGEKVDGDDRRIDAHFSKVYRAGGAGWGRLIRPLDEGTLDLLPMLKKTGRARV